MRQKSITRAALPSSLRQFDHISQSIRVSVKFSVPPRGQFIGRTAGCASQSGLCYDASRHSGRRRRAGGGSVGLLSTWGSICLLATTTHAAAAWTTTPADEARRSFVRCCCRAGHVRALIATDRPTDRRPVRYPLRPVIQPPPAPLLLPPPVTRRQVHRRRPTEQCSGTFFGCD